MFRGETWCYRGGTNHYSLTAFFHEYFSTPVSLKIYGEAGNPDGQALPCQERLAEMQARYEWTMGASQP